MTNCYSVRIQNDLDLDFSSRSVYRSSTKICRAKHLINLRLFDWRVPALVTTAKMLMMVSCYLKEGFCQYCMGLSRHLVDLPSLPTRCPDSELLRFLISFKRKYNMPWFRPFSVIDQCVKWYSKHILGYLQVEYHRVHLRFNLQILQN